MLVNTQQFNVNFQGMLNHLKEKKDVGFFTSIAGLMNSCSVLDLDAFERNTKAEGKFFIFKYFLSTYLSTGQCMPHNSFNFVSIALITPRKKKTNSITLNCFFIAEVEFGKIIFFFL